MNSKTLLSLLAAGTIGCSNYKPTLYLPSSVNLDPNEIGGYIFGKVNKETRSGEYCSREVLLGTEGGNLQSVVMTEHCKKLSSDNGTAWLKRYKDTDNDGDAEEVCEEEVKVFYGFSFATPPGCSDSRPYSMKLLLRDALKWVLEIRDQ